LYALQKLKIIKRRKTKYFGYVASIGEIKKCIKILVWKFIERLSLGNLGLDREIELKRT
jgi:hypothetical protein